MTAVVAGAKRALAKTPDLLPVLKEVGVVDSGVKDYYLSMKDF